ncbi:MAG: hypothetical protein SFU56_05275 [Capsulimonadales bacterium]|nr:hypothetical protein [Capsulimonadales bacterium]
MTPEIKNTENVVRESSARWGGPRDRSGRKRNSALCPFRISVRLDNESCDRLMDYCERTGQGPSAAIREILRGLGDSAPE